MSAPAWVNEILKMPNHAAREALFKNPAWFAELQHSPYKQTVLRHCCPQGPSQEMVAANEDLKIPGTVVVVLGLVSKPNLNHRAGRVKIPLDAKFGRVAVKMLTTVEQISVKAKNLMPIQADEDLNDPAFNSMTKDEKNAIKNVFFPQDEPMEDKNEDDEDKNVDDEDIIGTNVRKFRSVTEAMDVCTYQEEHYDLAGDAGIIVLFLEDKIDFITPQANETFLSGMDQTQRKDFQDYMTGILNRDGAKHLVWMLNARSKLRQTGKELIDKLEQSAIADDNEAEGILV